MKDEIHRLWLLLLLAIVPECLSAQTLYNHDTTYICAGGFGYASITHSYVRHMEAFDSWAVVDGVDSSWTLDISYTCYRGSEPGEGYGYIDIWDGDAATGILLINHFIGSSINIQSLPITQERVTIHVHYNAYSIDTIYPLVRNLSIFCRDVDGGSYTHSCDFPFSVRIENVTTTSAEIKWMPDTIAAVFWVNGQNYTGSGGSLQLTGLMPNTRYDIKAIPVNREEALCCYKRANFYTIPQAHIGCPDVLDLHSEYVRCYNDDNIGIEDYGPLLAFSRHTVHTNSDEIDSIAGRQLHTVCPEMPGSVRLGNWLNGAQHESIVYYLHVDTMLYSLILLHYAAVLQNPNHSPSAQPRFTMRILDQNDSVIDPQCGAADFVSDTSLGWNIDEPEVLWKDWTTVGINLAPYHGQDVRLQFTTYDCAEGAHFGYAYFYVECQQPYATADHCGTVDTVTLTAPDGFNYLWYYDSPTNPVATTQSAVCSSSEGTVHCRLSFVENPACYITMDAYVSNFWPSAVIDTLYAVDHGCDGFEVHFLNRSTILGDDTLPLPNHPPCETARWNFGDGFYSDDYSPVHTYRHPGTYTVTLISGLSTDQCTDTATFILVTPDAWAPGDKYATCCDSLLWIDSIWYSHDTVGPTARVHFYYCDTIYTLHLTTLPTSHYFLPTDTFCYNSGYTWRGEMVSISHSADTLFHELTDTLVAANGCDSIDHLPLVQLPPDPVDIGVRSDCGAGFYILVANTANPFWQWGSEPYDPLLDGHENDREVGIFPDSAVVYYLTTYYGDSLFCPTTMSVHLLPPSFSGAELEVNPSVLTYDRTTLYAYDRSDDSDRRRWIIVNHGANHDTIVLSDSLPRIVYTVSTDYDSVTVVLAAGNDFCNDTVSQTIPIVRSAVFAPNIFTPDDGQNNRFIVVCNGALEGELTIYNRQGFVVFSTDDMDKGWDGMHAGTPCTQGAYVWHLRYRTVDRPSDWQETLGTVTLLR